MSNMVNIGENISVITLYILYQSQNIVTTAGKTTNICFVIFYEPMLRFTLNWTCPSVVVT